MKYGVLFISDCLLELVVQRAVYVEKSIINTMHFLSCVANKIIKVASNAQVHYFCAVLF